MRLPRWLHRFYAWVTGRFWLPCPHCGAVFGGHEWLFDQEYRANGHLASVWIEGGHHRAICPACTLAGVGCLSHAAHNRRHLRCPYLAGLLKDDSDPPVGSCEA